MSIVSRKMKGGRTYAQYGCSARHHKGPSICANGLTIGEARLTDADVDGCTHTSLPPKPWTLQRCQWRMTRDSAGRFPFALTKKHGKPSVVAFDARTPILELKTKSLR
jgi:hypothetical protein